MDGYLDIPVIYDWQMEEYPWAKGVIDFYIEEVAEKNDNIWTLSVGDKPSIYIDENFKGEGGISFVKIKIESASKGTLPDWTSEYAE